MYTLIVFVVLLVTNSFIAGVAIYTKSKGPRWLELLLSIVYGLLNLLSFWSLALLVRLDFGNFDEVLACGLSVVMTLVLIAVSCEIGVLISKTLKG